MLGRVQRRTGRVHYTIALDDGRHWERHVDQIQKIGNVPTCGEETVDLWDYEPSEAEIQPEANKLPGTTGGIAQRNAPPTGSNEAVPGDRD